MKKLKKSEIKTAMDEARYEIERAIRDGGPFTRKILGIVLPAFSNYYGPKYTNELIKEYDLVSRYDIEKFNEIAEQ